MKGLKKRASSRFSKDKAIEELGDFEAIALLDGHLGRVGRVRRNEDVSRLEQAEGRLDLELAEALQRLCTAAQRSVSSATVSCMRPA